MTNFDEELQILKDKLLAMASHAESAVSRSIRALTDRDDMLARRTQLCAGLVTERLVQDRPAGRIEHHRCTPLPRVWIEQLPDSQAAAVALISELGR